MTSIPTAYPDPYRKDSTTDWRVFETLWHRFKDGDILPGKSGVPPEVVAEIIGTSQSSIQRRLRELERQGVVTRLGGLDPDTLRHRVTWAPTALVDDSPTFQPSAPRGVHQ